VHSPSKKKNFSNSSKKSYSHDSKASSSKGKAPMKEQEHVSKGVCRHCKKKRLHERLCRVS
jgi:hypothetical protein